VALKEKTEQLEFLNVGTIIVMSRTIHKPTLKATLLIEGHLYCLILFYQWLKVICVCVQGRLYLKRD